jgi:hypothetical protein
MAGISDKNSPEALEARQSYIQKMQASQNSYEQRIEGQGGEPDHVEYDENGVAKDNSGNPVGPARSAAPPSNGSGPATPAKTAQPAAAPIAKPPQPGAQLSDKATAKKYLDAAKGDKAKARELAKADGWKF